MFELALAAEATADHLAEAQLCAEAEVSGDVALDVHLDAEVR